MKELTTYSPDIMALVAEDKSPNEIIIELEGMRRSEMQASAAAGNAQSAARDAAEPERTWHEPLSEEEQISIGKACSFLPEDLKKRRTTLNLPMKA